MNQCGIAGTMRITVKKELLSHLLQAGNPLLDHLQLQLQVLAVDLERSDLILDRHHPATTAAALAHMAGMASCIMSHHRGLSPPCCFYQLQYFGKY
jgi:hypothetical protein